jgi:adenine-specific DNA-methyltransferase
MYSIQNDRKDVNLYWANSDKYYVKSSENMKDYSYMDNSGKRFVFKLVKIETERDNNKSKFKRCYQSRKENPFKIDGDTCNIYLEYKEGNINQDGYIKDIIDNCIKYINSLKAKSWIKYTKNSGEKTLLERNLKRYSSTNTSDYFIHKNLETFLAHELDLFIKNEILDIPEAYTQDLSQTYTSIVGIRIIQSVAQEIISFLAKFENLQKKLYLKKKFVVVTNYCITLDKVPEELYSDIATNEAQWDWWVKNFGVYDIRENFLKNRHNPRFSKTLHVEFLKENPFLVLDTSFFSHAFTEKLIDKIDNLDDSLDGLLVHGENFQGLRLLEKCYNNKIKCVYIDPPFNTNAFPIIYKNEYRDSSWLTFIYDRVSASYPLLKDGGIFAFAIDDNELKYSNILLDSIFMGEKLGTVVVRNNPSGRPTPTGFAISHEYILFYSKNGQTTVSKMPRSDAINMRYKETDDKGIFMWELLRKRGSDSRKEESPKSYYPIYFNGKIFRLPKMDWDDVSKEWINIEKPLKNETVCLPIDEEEVLRRWRWGVKTTHNNLDSLMYKEGKVPKIYYKYRPPTGVSPTTIWTDAKYSATEHGTGLLNKLFLDYQIFSFPKSVYAVEDTLLVSGLANNDYVLDYFAGSGTTAHAVINLNRKDNIKRKYILIEMGDFFNSVTKARILKAIYSNNWKAGKPQTKGTGISHMLKYITLESYEDTLDNVCLNNGKDVPTRFKDKDTLQYLMDYNLNGEIFLPFKTLSSPFDYNLQTRNEMESHDTKIDLIETFNYLIGLKIKKNHAQVFFDAEFIKYKGGALNARLKLGTKYSLKAIEGILPNGESALIIWRTLTDNISNDNIVLDAFLFKFGGYKKIFVNGKCDIKNASRIEDIMNQTMWVDV